MIVRRDPPHGCIEDAADGAGDQSGTLPGREEPALDDRVARLVGTGKRVRVVGAESEELRRRLEAEGCRVMNAEDTDQGRLDAIVLTDLPGPAGDSLGRLRKLREQLAPDGSLIVTLSGITAVGDRLAIVADGPLGRGSGILFTDDGLVALLEEAEYAVGHLVRVERVVDRPGLAVLHDILIVAYPLPVPGLDFIQRQLRRLARELQEARRDARAREEQVAVATERIALQAGHEQRMADRIRALRRHLLETHRQLIHRDDELRETYGHAIEQHHALVITRDRLAAERNSLRAERDALCAERTGLVEEQRALYQSLNSAQRRLDLLRASPLGLVYRAIRRLLHR
jgi:hypothetical protein